MVAKRDISVLSCYLVPYPWDLLWPQVAAAEQPAAPREVAALEQAWERWALAPRPSGVALLLAGSEAAHLPVRSGAEHLDRLILKAMARLERETLAQMPRA